MRILSDRGVEGMVQYREASEIPALVVMDYVDGPNLATAKEAGYLNEWSLVLRVAHELTSVLRRAHSLPERVLHRDLRPENVMLRDYYTPGSDWQLVVLDFDLSWHRDANQRSVLHTSSAGYLAPEQMHRTPGVSTRSALVDSFGLGMTLLYLCRGTDPAADEHRQVGWLESIQTACRSVGDTSWASVPTRFERLIQNCTKDTQSARWDLATIEGELQRLRTAVDAPKNLRSAEILTEELAAQTAAFQDYEWDADTLRASKALPTGLRYALSADLQRERVLLTVTWAATGVERGGIRKYLGPAAKVAADQLTAAGWRQVRTVDEGKSFALYGHLPTTSLTVGDLLRRVEEVGGQLDRALANLRF